MSGLVSVVEEPDAPTSPPLPFTIELADEKHLPGILAIYNDAILHSTVTWTDDPVDLDSRRAWLHDLHSQGCPVFVAIAHAGGDVLGFAYYGPFRSKHGYRFTAEVTVYVARDCRGNGVGSGLLLALIGHAHVKGLHMLVAGIDAENASGIRFFKRAGFVETARLPEVGFKFGGWRDLVLSQLKIKEQI